MGYPDLPSAVKTLLADEEVRTHHHLWHFVRNRSGWDNLSDANRAQLEAEHWKAPRFENEPGSGIDFLGMHRHMIEMANSALLASADPNWPSVIGWDPIPWPNNHSDWPVPEWQKSAPTWASDKQWKEYTNTATQERTPARIQEMQRVSEQLDNSARLKGMTLDQLGTAIEWSIHGWMHIRWSGKPKNDAFSSDISNDWLFLPWSSHVNKHFWKLHGWIDNRIGKWETATGEQADLTGAWAGPAGAVHHEFHKADTKLLSLIPPRQTTPLPMQIKQDVIENILR